MLTQDDLWDALDTLGTDGDASTISTDVADQLIAFKMAEWCDDDGSLALTPYGEQAFVVMESGDGRVYEFEDFPPVGI